MVVGMLINDTEFMAVASDIIEYTIPLVKEYTWSVLKNSAVRVSDVWVDLSNPLAVRFLKLPKFEDVIFVAETLPDIKPVAVKSFTVAKTDDDIFAPETLPEIKPVAVKSLTVAKTDDVIFAPETFPEIKPVAVKSFTLAKTDDVIFAPETFPEIKPVAVRSLTVAKVLILILSTVIREATLTVPLKVVFAELTTTPEFFK
jgi:hypothetical protein